MSRSFYSLIVALAAMVALSISHAAPANPQVLIKTEKGDILVELYASEAPVTVDNFVKHVNSYHYDGLIFHRVINKFMIQTGGFTFDLSPRQSERPTIVNEGSNGLKNKRGTLAMARTNHPDSAQAQFFINHKSNKFLDSSDKKLGYAVFGRVIDGMKVVDAIAEVETATKQMYQDVPVEAIRILSARLVNPEAWTPLPEVQPKAKKLSFERPVPIK